MWPYRGGPINNMSVRRKRLICWTHLIDLLGGQEPAFLLDKIGSLELDTEVVEHFSGRGAEQAHDAGKLVVSVLASEEGALQVHLGNGAASGPHICEI